MKVNYLHKTQYELRIGLRELFALNKLLTRKEGLAPAEVEKIEAYFKEKGKNNSEEYYIELYKKVAKTFKDSRAYLYKVQQSDLGRLGNMVGYTLIRLHTIQKSFESFAGGFFKKSVRFVQDYDFEIIKDAYNGTGHAKSSFVQVINWLMEDLDKYKAKRGIENVKVEELLAQAHEIPIKSLDEIAKFVEI